MSFSCDDDNNHLLNALSAVLNSLEIFEVI